MATTALKGTPVQTNSDLPAVGSDAPDFLLVGADLSEKTLAASQGRRRSSRSTRATTRRSARPRRAPSTSALQASTASSCCRQRRPSLRTEAFLRRRRLGGCRPAFDVPRKLPRGLRCRDGRRADEGPRRPRDRRRRRERQGRSHRARRRHRRKSPTTTQPSPRSAKTASAALRRRRVRP